MCENDLLVKLKKLYLDEDFEKISRAYYFAEKAHDGQLRKSGERYFIHPCAVVDILADLRVDADTLCAAFLHDVLEDTPVTSDDIKNNFGETVLELVDGVTKLDRIRYENIEEEQAENFRKMFVAMAKDYRVILIKLADRLHNMRSIAALTENRQLAISKETMEIYAKLAGRLGLSYIKCELEDTAMKYLYPNDYNELMEFIQKTQEQRLNVVNLAIAEIREKLDELGINGEINGRPKHLYSIWRKMKKENKSFEQIYDLTAVRVIVDEIKDCYTVLGTIHTMWKPIPGRFKDYIAMPKPNKYQSLHTTVITNFKETLEIQIRTFEMHRIAEYGIAAHWKYKEGTKDSSDANFNWFRDVLAVGEEEKGSSEYLDSIKINLFSDEVFVFTPKGAVVNLPNGSTPVDFAYSVHSAVGNKCIGAKVDKKIVPLNTVLETGQIVEIITSNTARGPSLDWLKFVKTPGARSKIRQYFKKEHKEENVKRGRDMLEREAKRRGYNLAELMSPDWLEYVMNRYSIPTVEELYNSVGYGGFTTNQILIKLIDFFKRDLLSKNPVAEIKGEAQHKSSGDGVLIRGYDDFVVRLSHCCNPVPGDKIVGYVSRGRGVSVHCVDCPNVKGMEPERLIEAKWDSVIDQSFTATLKIDAGDYVGLLADITAVIANMKVPILAAVTKVAKNKEVMINVSIEVKSLEQLDEVSTKIKNIKGVENVYR